MRFLQAFVFIGFFSVTTAHAIKDGQSVIKSHLKPKGVAAISAVNPSGEQQSLCSGVFISDHLMLTAKHCVMEGLPLLTTIDARPLKSFVLAPASAIRASASLDLALIAYPANTAKTYTSIASLPQIVGDILETRGFGGNGDPEASMTPIPEPGRATELAARYPLFKLIDDSLQFRLHPTAQFSVEGDSGSPVFNKAGELVGIMITYERLDATDQYGNEWVQNTAIALSSDAAKNFIQKASADIANPAKP